MIYGLLVALLILAAVTWYQSRRMFLIYQEREQLKIENREWKVKADGLQAAQEALQSAQEEVNHLRVERGRLESALEEYKRSVQEKLDFFAHTKEGLSDTFRSLSHDVLEKNQQLFLQLARESFSHLHEQTKGELDSRQKSIGNMLEPVHRSLEKLDRDLNHLEREREKATGSLKAQNEAIIEAHKGWSEEMASWKQLFYSPSMRGRWGEVQLRRVVELAGMVEHCDFSEQKMTDNGQRPDLIVHLPGDKRVIVDAKTPSSAYLEAMQATVPAIKAEKVRQHACHVKRHILSLGKKKYGEMAEGIFECVILFVPSDHLLNVALECDPTLIEIGISHGVMMATPMTLVGLLRAISQGWKQEKLSQSAQEIYKIGRELYRGLAETVRFWVKMGKSISGSVDSYNQASASLQRSVLSSAKKLTHLGVTSDHVKIPTVEAIDRQPRTLQPLDQQNDFSSEC